MALGSEVGLGGDLHVEGGEFDERDLIVFGAGITMLGTKVISNRVAMSVSEAAYRRISSVPSYNLKALSLTDNYNRLLGIHIDLDGFCDNAIVEPDPRRAPDTFRRSTQCSGSA